MSILYIAELNAIGGTGNYNVPGPQMPPIAEQTVPIGPSSNPSNTFTQFTNYVRVEVDTTCSIAWALPGETTVAATNNMRLAANQTEYFNVVPGGSCAVIANT